MRNATLKSFLQSAGLFALGLAFASVARASEADLHLPELNMVYNLFGTEISGNALLGWGMVISALGMVFGLVEFNRIKNLKAHKSMLDISHLIYETCKTYMIQQGKLLIVLELFIGACIVYYFGVLEGKGAGTVSLCGC